MILKINIILRSPFNVLHSVLVRTILSNTVGHAQIIGRAKRAPHAHWGVQSRFRVIGERSEPHSDKFGGEICIATRALVCIYICLRPDYRIRPDDSVRPDDCTVPTLYIACAVRAK